MTHHPTTLEIDLQNKSLTEVQKAVELKYLESALTRADGNKERAASIAGIPVRTLRRKLARYSIHASYTLK